MDLATESKTVTSDPQNIKGRILEYHVKMKLQGYKDSTIRLSSSVLKVLMDANADLTKPETVKQAIAQKSWSGNRIRNVCNAYTQFLTYLGQSWTPPNYTITRKIPFIPTEQEIDDLVAGMPNTLSVFLQLLKETAMRSGEAIQIPWKDVDLERRVIMCNEPEKGSNPRIFSDLSGKLLSMLNALPRENERVFGHTTINSLKATFTRSRKRLAFKLGNPRLNEIHFHSLRHWKATMLYHYLHDLLVVAEFLGHKDIENTRLYIQLEKNLFKNVPDDKFIIRAISSLEEAVQLGEVGFEPFMVVNGIQLMRKRK
jgi:integrase